MCDFARNLLRVCVPQHVKDEANASHPCQLCTPRKFGSLAGFGEVLCTLGNLFFHFCVAVLLHTTAMPMRGQYSRTLVFNWTIRSEKQTSHIMPGKALKINFFNRKTFAFRFVKHNCFKGRLVGHGPQACCNQNSPTELFSATVPLCWISRNFKWKVPVQCFFGPQANIIGDRILRQYGWRLRPSHC